MGGAHSREDESEAIARQPARRAAPSTAAALRSARAPISPSQFHALQRAAGNRAVAATLQRTPAPAVLQRDAPGAVLEDSELAAQPEWGPWAPGVLNSGASGAPGGGPASGAGPASSAGPAPGGAPTAPMSVEPEPVTMPEPAQSVPAGPTAPMSVEPEPVTMPEPEPVSRPPAIPEPTPTSPGDLGIAGPSPESAPDSGPGVDTALAPGAAGTGGAPTSPGAPTAASAPFDFTDWVWENRGNAARTGLEFGRLIPGLGLYSGLAADGIQFAQDVDAVPGASGDHPLFTGILMARNGINVLNGAIGHVVYINELVQDGLAVSVIGAEFIPVSASAHSVAALAKAYFSTCLMFLDNGLMIGAHYNSKHNPDQQEAWNAMTENYAANALGSEVSVVMDVIALASAGVSNTGIVSAQRGALAILARMAKNWGQTLWGWAQQMFNVWGGDWLGKLGDGGQPAPAVQQEADPLQRLAVDGFPEGLTGRAADLALAPIMLTQAQNLRLTAATGRVAWGQIDGQLALAADVAAQSLANMDAVAGQLFDGKSSFEVIRDASDTALAAMEERIAALQQFQAAASDGKTNADAVRSGAGEILTAAAGLTVPNIQIPRTELGDGLFANLAEGVVNAGAGVANYALEAMVNRARGAVDLAKGAVTAPVEGLRDNATEIGEFLALAATMTAGKVAAMQEFVGGFRAAMAQTTGFENAMDTIIAQVAELTGVPAFRIQDIRDGWGAIPGIFDDLDGLADRLEQRAGAILAGAPAAPGEGAPLTAAQPTNPDDDDAPR